MKFIEIEQDGKTAAVNPDNVAFVLPNALVNTSNIVTIAGVSVPVAGSVREVTAKLEGKSTLI